MKVILSLLLTFSFAACSSAQKPESLLSDFDEADYKSTIKQNSQVDERYSGLDVQLIAGATFLSAKVRNLVLKKSFTSMQFTPDEQQKEREKSIKEMATQSEFFLSFFVPNDRHDDLNLKKSVWRLLLTVDGKTYTGTARKLNQTYQELQQYYAFHNRWSSAYIVSFDVPTATIEPLAKTFSITGVLGETHLRFEPLK